MRKIATVYIGVMILLLATAVIRIQHFNEDKDINVFDEIQASPCAKFECNDNSNETIYITSEILSISASVSSLCIVDGGMPIDQWLYRITFNCNEIYLNAKEIVLVVGPNSMSINGVLYTTPDEVPFENIIRFFDAKYKHFSE
ncbi:MAG: hypothetical protein HUJ80_07315 [Firmicutes bacterium]|nr:hypothetical protein [Bacillota bacterium]